MRRSRWRVAVVTSGILAQSACGSATGTSGTDSSSAPGSASTPAPVTPASGFTAFAYCFADAGAIVALPVGGGPGKVVFRGDANAGTVGSFTFDAGGVYFSLVHRTTAGASGIAGESFSLHTLRPGGGPVTTIATGLEGVGHLAKAGAYLYFADQSRVDVGMGNGDPLASVDRIPVEGGDVEVLATVAKSVHEIAVDSSYVYWTQNDPVTATDPVIGEVMRAPLAGGLPETLAQGQHRPYAIAVDASGLYWADQGTSLATDVCALTDGTIMTLDATGAPVTLASGLVAVSGAIAARDGDVYWSILGGPCMLATGSVLGLDRATGSTRTRATGLAPGGVYVNETTLYFTSTTGDPVHPAVVVTAMPR